MPGIKVKLAGRVAYIEIAGNYKPGDPAPSGYCDWHEWAEVQHKAGLRQKECGMCGKWQYPQELSEQVITSTVHVGRPDGPERTMTSVVCLNCAKSRPDERAVGGEEEGA